MSNSIPTSTLEKFTAFGDLLRFLRRRAGITQLELSIAVNYSGAQISRLEQNLRLPDLTTIEARFVSALGLEEEPKAVARLLDLAANVRREDAPIFGLSPYKGLNYFDEADADLFVGREALTAKLEERVLALAKGQKPGGIRFLAILGASGSGKSSLVRAGLVPALRWNKRSAEWPIHILTPTAHPLESLAMSQTPSNGSVGATAALMDDLMRDPRSLQLFIKRGMQAGTAFRLLIVVDQFEELFALCHSEVERTAFIDNLLTVASEADGSIVVVITLRADFYAHCAGYLQLREALAQEQEYIGAMNDEELRRAIEEPAQRGRWEFEPGLVDQLLHDVGHEPGALPLLSHALLETWQRRRGRTMTLSGYAASGGVRGAIAETAESVFVDQFTHEQQAIARRIFLRLTELGDETATGDTRRRATFDELILKPEEAETTRAVLMTLADARLITTSEDSVEVAHEALIREWPTLRGWLEDDRESLRLHRHLTETSQEWSALNRERDLLYRGARLTQIREWAVAHPDEMNDLERTFIDASQAAAEREAAEREAQRERELEAAQKLAEEQRQRAEEQIRSANRLRSRNRLLTAVGAAALVLALLAVLFGVQSSYNLGLAGKNLARAESLRLAAEANFILSDNGNAETAILLSIRALKSAYSFQADAALAQSLNHLYNLKILSGHNGWIYSVAYSSDGKYVLTGSQDGTARLWDVQNGREVQRFTGHKGGVSAAAFSPDGRLVLTGGNDKTARLWEVASGKELRVFTGHTDGLTAVAFSPDGLTILTASGDDTARLWDPATGQEIREFNGHTGLVSDAVFSPDGRTILTGSFDNTARLWDAATGQPIRTFIPADTGNSNRRVTSVAFSPDGKFVLIGSDDRMAYLWEAATGQGICTFTGHTDTVNDVAFSPDGKYVLTGSEDKTARVWQSNNCQEVRQYVGHESGVKAVAFSPDGLYVLTGSEDDTARLWAAPAAAPLRTFNHQSPNFTFFTYTPEGVKVVTHVGVNSVAFSPDGKFVLTGGDDGVARLWDIGLAKELHAFIGHTQSVTSVVFSPDGKLVLTGSADRTAKLWDAETGQLLHTLAANTEGVATAVFSPDGKYLITSGGLFSSIGYVSNSTLLWEVSNGQQVRVFNLGPYDTYNDTSSIVAFSPDGNKVVIKGFTYDDAILFDVKTGRQICDFIGSLAYVTSVAFSPDGRYVLTGSEDRTARLWDARTCRQLRVFTDNVSLVIAVAFSPDGKYVLTGHDDNKARLWNTASGAELREFQGHTSWLNSVAFSPDGRYVLTGSEDGTARLWDTDYHDTVKFACSLVWRDLTTAERQLYSITDNAPTCPKP